MKIAIITRNENSSPKVLAKSLATQLDGLGFNVELFFATDLLRRLRSISYLDFHPFFKYLKEKVKYYFKDHFLLKKLSSYDVIILSECIPNAFWRNHYAIEELRLRARRPIILYEVYYLGNAPTQVQKLKSANESLFERYDWHLSVSAVTEIRVSEEKPWSCIGLNLAHTGLYPSVKKEFIAIVDFPQKGYEYFRSIQLKVLKELGIKTICLDGNYSIPEIRSIYKEATVYFMQSAEAFGLPLAECFACGAVVFTPCTSWPMSWRLDKDPQIHGEGTLGEGIFRLYSDEEDLRSQLLELLQNYDLAQTPQWVFSRFTEIYPHYYYGRPEVLKNILNNLIHNN